MKSKLMSLLLVASGLVFAQTCFSIGEHVGAPAYYPPAPAPVVVTPYRPPCPGSGYVWIDGYYDGYGNWFDGYWALPSYAGAYWVAPRFSGGHFYAGYWDGARGYGRDEYRFRESRVSGASTNGANTSSVNVVAASSANMNTTLTAEAASDGASSGESEHTSSKRKTDPMAWIVLFKGLND